MKRLFSLGVLVLAALLAGSTVAAAGETCETATSLSQGVTSGDLGQAETLWFEFEAPETADFSINTHYSGTDFAVALSVRESCADAPIAGRKGDWPGRNAYVRLPLIGGQTYSIQLGRAAGSGSSFQIGIDVALGTCPLAGDCFAANGDPGCNDTCGGPPCPGCCDLICGADAFCCDVEWDQICADAATGSCNVVPVGLQSIGVERR